MMSPGGDRNLAHRRKASVSEDAGPNAFLSRRACAATPPATVEGAACVGPAVRRAARPARLTHGGRSACPAAPAAAIVAAVLVRAIRRATDAEPELRTLA